MSKINDLRADIKRLRNNATKKASRIRTTHGANITGTDFDPRRLPGTEKKYNMRQLLAYKQSLESFLDRKTQFVGLRSGPVPRSDWLKYKAAETAYNSHVNTNFEKVKDRELPKPVSEASRGETIGERMAKMTPDHRVMRGSSVNSPYDPIVRDPMGVKDNNALRKLTESAERRLRESQMGKDLDSARDQFDRMKFYIGDNDPIFKGVESLNDEQFSILWYFTSFADNLSMEYNLLKMLNEGKGKAYAAPTIATARENYSELIDWAKKI